MGFDDIDKKFRPRPIGPSFEAIDAQFRAAPIKPQQYAWWCNTCWDTVDGHHVTYQETHDPNSGGCGNEVIPYCSTCDGGGWLCTSTPSGRGPLHYECDDCGNPQGNPSP